MKHSPLSAPSEHKTTGARPLGLVLLRLSGGDRALFEGYQAVAWSIYEESGCPYGRSEEGCDRWWAEELETGAWPD